MKRAVVVIACLLIAVSAWAAGGKVVVYTAHEETIINALVPMFEKETGIKVEYVKMASGDVINRAKAEASRPQADVIWSIGGEQLEAENAILAPYTPKEWDKINPVYKVGTNWLPYTGIMNVFIVNTKMLTPDKYPKTWTDLMDTRFKKLISSARADKSGSSYMQLCNVISIYGDKGWDVYKGIMKNMVISASSGAVPKFVNDGEQAVSALPLKTTPSGMSRAAARWQLCIRRMARSLHPMGSHSSKVLQTLKMQRFSSTGASRSQFRSTSSMQWPDALSEPIARIRKDSLRFRRSRQFPMILAGPRRTRPHSLQSMPILRWTLACNSRLL